MSECYDDVIREYIDFVNEQVGTYMDALAGFAGHYTRVQRQVHRVSRPVGKRQENGETIVVYASYEDPSKPDIIHNRIVRADTYIEANSPGGSNEQRHARAIVVFLFTYWEDEIRPRLAAAKDAPVNEIKSDIMGDLRILRHAILHAKSSIRPEEHRRLKVLALCFRRVYQSTFPTMTCIDCLSLSSKIARGLCFRGLGSRTGLCRLSSS